MYRTPHGTELDLAEPEVRAYIQVLGFRVLRFGVLRIVGYQYF